MKEIVTNVDSATSEFVMQASFGLKHFFIIFRGKLDLMDKTQYKYN